MARTRKTPQNKTAKQTESGDKDALTCPECGRTFTRPASLGAHRNRAHGISGASKRRRTRTRSRNGRTTQSARASQAARQQTERARSRGSSDGDGTRIDRDALLQTLFPNGVPAREEVIRRANAWLDEAEKLASAK